MTVLERNRGTLPGLPLVEVLVQQSDLLRPDWLATQLDDVLRVRPDRVVVDLTRCSTIDATSLRVLLGTHRELRRRRGVLVLRGLSPPRAGHRAWWSRGRLRRRRALAVLSPSRSGIRTRPPGPCGVGEVRDLPRAAHTAGR